MTSLTVNSKLRGLAGDVLGAVVLGERRVDGLLLARGDADEALLEAGDEPAGADLDELVAALAARERLAVDRALEVQDHEVAVGGRPVDDLQAREALAHVLQLLLDGLGIGARLAPGDLESAVGAERGAGPHADLEGERERLALLGQLAQVDVGVAHGRDARLVDCRHVPVRQAAANGLVEDRLAADALDDDGRRDLAGAKARDLHLAPELARLDLQRALDLLRGDLDVDAHARLGQLGDGGGDCDDHATHLIVRGCAAAVHPSARSPPGSSRDRSATSTPAWRTGSASSCASHARAGAWIGCERAAAAMRGRPQSLSANTGQRPGTPLRRCSPR